jgi:hypothetical protein
MRRLVQALAQRAGTAESSVALEVLEVPAPPAAAAAGRRALRQASSSSVTQHVAAAIRLPTEAASDAAYVRLQDASALNAAITAAIGLPAAMSPLSRSMLVTVSLALPDTAPSSEAARAAADAAAAALSAAVASGEFANAIRGDLGADAPAFSVLLSAPPASAVTMEFVTPAMRTPAEELLAEGPTAGVIIGAVVVGVLLMAGLMAACRDKRDTRERFSAPAKPAAAPAGDDAEATASPPRSQRLPWERTPLPAARPGGARAQLLHTHSESPESHPFGTAPPQPSPPLAPLPALETAETPSAAGATPPHVSSVEAVTPPPPPGQPLLDTTPPLSTPPSGKRMSALLSVAGADVNAPPGWLTPLPAPQPASQPASPQPRVSGVGSEAQPASPQPRVSGVGSEAGSERSERAPRSSFFDLFRSPGSEAAPDAAAESPAFPPNPLFTGGAGADADASALGDDSGSDEEALPTRMSPVELEQLSGGGARGARVSMPLQCEPSSADGTEGDGAPAQLERVSRSSASRGAADE